MACLQNPIEKWIPIASGYELCIKISSILVSYIHCHLGLVVGINNNRYIKLFLAFSRKKCGICSTCIGTLVAWMFLILSTSESSPLRGWIVDIMVTGELSIHSRVATSSLTAPLQK